MTTATKEKQSLLQEFGIKYEAMQRLGDTIELQHQAAYTRAALKHLRNTQGELDYKMLQNADVRTAMADNMADYYLEQAREYFRVDEKASKLSDMQKEMLLNAYAGITRGQLKSEIHQAEDAFTLKHFAGRVDEIKKRIMGQLVPTAYEHVKDTAEHKKAVLKEMGLEGKIDSELLRVDELHQLMELHQQNGGILSPRSYQRLPAYKATQAKGGGAPAPAHH